MQNINKYVTNAPQLVRILRWIAWAELLAIALFAILSFCSTFNAIGYYGGSLSSVSTLLVTVLQASVFWGLLMGVALLLENQSNKS
jgi:hypothetical protein